MNVSSSASECQPCPSGQPNHVKADYAVNELMRPVYDLVRETQAAVSLRPDLRKILDAGVVSISGRVYLAYFARKRHQATAAMDQFTAERWVNDVHIASSLPASDPAWRADVLTQALLIASGLIEHFVALARHPAQAVIGLQSAPGTAVHLCQLTRPDDDARLGIEEFAQPILVITTDNSST